MWDLPLQGPGHLISGITSPSPVPAVVLSALTVHSAPSSASCALGTLEAGAAVQVVERRGDWLRHDAAWPYQKNVIHI